MTTSTICVFRHGETEWNIEGRYQGHMNSPLTSQGVMQARENARILRQHSSLLPLLTIYASPLHRVKETASIMIDELGMSPDVICYDDRLMEASFGDCEGLTEAEVAQKYPEFWKKRSTDCWNARPPFGESYADLSARVHDWYNDVKFSGTTIVICHAMTSRVMRGIYMDLPHQDIVNLPKPHDGFFKLCNGQVSHVTH